MEIHQISTLKRLRIVLSHIQQSDESKCFIMNKCNESNTRKKSENKEEIFVSSRLSSHALKLSSPELKKYLVPTSLTVDKIHAFEIDHLDNIFRRTQLDFFTKINTLLYGNKAKKNPPKLKRYRNKWFRSREKEHNMRYNGFVGDDDGVLLDIVRGKNSEEGIYFKRSGARKQKVWEQGTVKAAIVTCGRMCPGLNNVITSLVETLYYNYGVDTIFGIDGGYIGFWNSNFQPWTRLTPQMIKGINDHGGTTLMRSDYGGFKGCENKIITSILHHGVNQVYIIGGNGTHRAASILQKELKKRRLRITVAAVPKAIDNDVAIIDRSFGFNTAIAKAKEAVKSAIVEAKCAPKGIGIIKLMGQDSGYIAAMVTLICPGVDLCMIPEIDFRLYGAKTGILPYLHQIINKKDYAVIVVTAGSGSNMMKRNGDKDADGNLIQQDIGEFLKKRIKNYFKDKFTDGSNVKLKYHDPTYMIGTVPANADDAILCTILASNAVHGAMAGYTGFSSGIVNNKTVMIPMDAIVAASPSRLNTKGRTWERVLAQTHQPRQEF